MAFAGFLAFARAWITPAIIPALPAPLPTEDAARVPESELAVSEEELDVLEEEEEEKVQEKEADAPEEEWDVLEMEVDVPEREAICTPHPTEKAARVQEQKVEILEIRKGRDVRIKEVIDAAKKARDRFDRSMAALREVVDSTEEEVDVPDREAVLTSRPTVDAAPIPRKEVDLPERGSDPFRLLDLPMDIFSLVMDEYMSDVTFDEMWTGRETCCTFFLFPHFPHLFAAHHILPLTFKKRPSKTFSQPKSPIFKQTSLSTQTKPPSSSSSATTPPPSKPKPLSLASA
jgi:hypothetical protein